MMGNDSTVLLTNLQQHLNATEEEAADAHAALLAISGTMKGKIYDLPSGELIFGRSDECEIQIESQGISRKHFQITVSDHEVTISDLKSRNGTFLNDIIIKKTVTLKKGDIIKFGDMVLKFIPRGDPEHLTLKKLSDQANIDGLTKCFNKQYFQLALEEQLRRSQEKQRILALIIFDIDHFKKLNDNFGHDAGDYVLRDLCQIIREKTISPEMIFSRYGGEEFTILMPSADLQQGHKMAEKIREVVAGHHFIYEKKTLPVTISLGISSSEQQIIDATDMFKKADSALFKSKERGRNQSTSFR